MKNSDFDWKARLRQIRTERKLTQKDMARLCGVSQATVSQYETDARAGTIEGLGHLLDGLHVSFAEFFCDCHNNKRRTDSVDFNPSQFRKKAFRVIKNSSIK